jgi:hypothetical protein
VALEIAAPVILFAVIARMVAAATTGLIALNTEAALGRSRADAGHEGVRQMTTDAIHTNGITTTVATFTWSARGVAARTVVTSH